MNGPHIFLFIYLFLLCAATSSPPFVTSAAPSSVLRWRRLWSSINAIYLLSSLTTSFYPSAFLLSQLVCFLLVCHLNFFSLLTCVLLLVLMLSSYRAHFLQSDSFYCTSYMLVQRRGIFKKLQKNWHIALSGLGSNAISLVRLHPLAQTEESCGLVEGLMHVRYFTCASEFIWI